MTHIETLTQTEASSRLKRKITDNKAILIILASFTTPPPELFLGKSVLRKFGKIF